MPRPPSIAFALSAAVLATLLRPLFAAVPASEVCGPNGGQVWPLERFKNAYVCLTVNDKRAVFDTLADSFRAVEFSGSFNAWARNTTDDVLLAVSSMGGSSTDTAFSTSTRKIYALTPPVNLAAGATNPERLVVSVYTAIVSVEKGLVESITFDDGCFLCGGSDSTDCIVNARQIMPGGAPIDEAAQRGCSKPISGCVDLPPAPGAASTDPLPNSCDLRLWITWQGTDVKGNYFSSMNKRFSRYRGWGLDLPGLAEKLSAIGEDAISRLQPGREDFQRRQRRLYSPMMQRGSTQGEARGEETEEGI